MAAKHVQIAESQGVQAGFDAYMSTPITRLHPAYAEISKKRTDATKLAAYCNLFGLTNDSNGVIESAKIGDVQSAAEQFEEFKAFKAFKAAAQGGITPSEAPAAPETSTPTSLGITNDEAWKALGADPAFKSKNRGSEAATNGQLYRLNLAGKLTLNS